ncbi:hypothetical protein PVAP13_2KG497605 [Panicum virgatum]|uniref:Uncharacterized protein n=1 Tax=Panicum virgatum TaxID=38727 RepID=A0A8T0WFZ3_PANVG|nr:hypothetical protein PVAP13_2KG497605 [Panicum virgatum]
MTSGPKDSDAHLSVRCFGQRIGRGRTWCPRNKTSYLHLTTASKLRVLLAPSPSRLPSSPLLAITAVPQSSFGFSSRARGRPATRPSRGREVKGRVGSRWIGLDWDWIIAGR